MADIEMMSDLLIGLLHGPQGGSPKIIDQYYEQYEQFEDEFPEQNRVKRQFATTLGTIERMFPNIVKVPRWGNRADFYSLFIALGNLLRDHQLQRSNERNLAKELSVFATKVDERLERRKPGSNRIVRKYARAIEKGSNDKARRTDRHEVLCTVMGTFSKRKENMTTSYRNLNYSIYR